MKETIRKEALALGFSAVGFVRAADVPDNDARLRAWLDAGRHGTMGWMEGRAEQRGHPSRLWDEVRSCVVLAMSYAPGGDPLEHAGRGEVGRVSVYARGDDYHEVMKARLKALARWLAANPSTGSGGAGVKVFVDTAPVLEKPLAEAAGLGWQGKHTNLLSRTLGNWFFLGSVWTTLDLDSDAPGVDRCGTCTACQRACPTAAFPRPYELDARRCLSYLTIEHRGPIPHEFRAAMGNRIYGCDDCLAACPWNRFADQAQAHHQLHGRPELEAPRLAELLALNDVGFRALFRKSPVKRIGRDRFVRNCLIAAGNSGEAGLLGPVRALLGDLNPVVAEAAAWAEERLTNTTYPGLRRGTPNQRRARSALRAATQLASSTSAPEGRRVSRWVTAGAPPVWGG